MKILVTGATGFLGNEIINESLKNNFEVIASSRNEAKAKSFDWYDSVTYIPFDLNEAQTTTADLFHYFLSPDKLIHLSWEGLPNYNEPFHFERNLFSNYHFLKNIISNGMKDVTITGTCFEYGMQNGCLKESMPADPKNPYAIAKDTLRRMLESMNKGNTFHLKWIRLFYMYGKGQSDKSLFTQMEKAVGNKDTEFKMSGGEQVRDFLPLKEMVGNIIKIALKDSNVGIVNCCSGKPQKVKDFVTDYFQSKGKDMKLILGHYPYPDYEPMEFWGDTNKLNSIIS